jgi:membrane protein required for colicin V production
MHTLDILFIIAAAFFIFTGTRRGLIGEVFRLAALIAGFFAAFLYYPELSKFFRFSQPYAANAMAFTLIFLAVILAIIGSGLLLKKAIHCTPLGWVDSLFGGAIGGLKTVLIFWVICLSCASLPPTKFARGLHDSFIFQTYKKLPPAAKLPSLVKMRSQFKNDRFPAVPQKPKGKNDTSTTPGGKKQ